MAILNNVPTLGYVSWKDVTITYEGQIYQIQNSYTMKPYIYWNYENPYVFVASNTMLKELAGRYYIMFNEKGNHTLVPQDDIELNFSEGGSTDYIADKILGFQEQMEINGERFTTIETTIDGIKQTVGEVKEDILGNAQTISQLEQSANQISASVSSLEREFNENLESQTLRGNVSDAILAFQSTLGLFNSDMNTYMEDNELSDVEEDEIASYISELDTKKLALYSQLDLVIGMMEAQGQTDYVTKLTTLKEMLESSHSTLISTINNAKLDKIFTNTEIATVISSFSNVNTKINEVNNLVNDAIYLGVGGSLIEELGKFTVKQNEIVLSVKKVETSVNNSLGVKKALLQGVISSNDTALVNFKNCFSVISTDREIIPEEIDSLNVRIEAMRSNVNNLTVKKDEVINDPLINEADKNEVTEKYNAFMNIYEQLKTTTTTILSDNRVDSDELATMDEIASDYYSALNDFHSSMCKSLDGISANEITKAINDAKNELKEEMQQLEDRMDALDENFDEAILSSLVDESEKKDIEHSVEVLKREKADVDSRFNQWYYSEFLYGTLKELYKNTYDTFIEKYNTLVDLSTTIANKTNMVTDAERIALENANNEFLMALDSFLTQSEEVIDAIGTNETTYVKNNLLKDFNDVNSMINNLNDTMNNAFKDEIISEIELKSINDLLTQIDKEKMDIDKMYDEIYNNENL